MRYGCAAWIVVKDEHSAGITVFCEGTWTYRDVKFNFENSRVAQTSRITWERAVNKRKAEVNLPKTGDYAGRHEHKFKGNPAWRDRAELRSKKLQEPERSLNNKDPEVFHKKTCIKNTQMIFCVSILQSLLDSPPSFNNTIIQATLSSPLFSDPSA